MENKEKQIEKMTKVMQKCYEKNGLLNFKWFAESSYKCLTEDSVVLSREEWEEYKEFKAFMERNDWGNIEDIETTLDKCQDVLCERLQETNKKTAESLLSELYYITRFYYGDSANILAWAKEKAAKLGVEIKE